MVGEKIKQKSPPDPKESFCRLQGQKEESWGLFSSENTPGAAADHEKGD